MKAVYLLHEKSHYHSDIRPYNIVFVKTKSHDKYLIKLIELGTCSTNMSVYKIWTERYFNSPLR